MLTLLLTLLAAPGHEPVAAASPAPAIAWEKDYDAALARAKAEGKVVFIAVNMDGERANDTLANEVYQEKAVVEWAGRAVCLVASRDEHSGAGKPCKRFGTVSCAEHIAVEARVRKEHLKPGPDGAVVSPQHVFLGPDGAVLMSVPYEIRERELLWCLAEAVNAAAPGAKVPAPTSARAPRRLIMGGVYESGDPETASRPLSDEELERTIAEIRAGLKGEERINAFFRVLATDHDDAVDFIVKEMKGAIFGRRVDARIRLIHAIGVYSPPSFWEALEIYVKDPDDNVRNEIAVALEQLAAKDSVKAIRAALAKEKDTQVKKNLLRALGTAGAEDKAARKALLKAAEDRKEPFFQVNALLALGSHFRDEDVDELLRGTLAAGDARLAQAAAMAIAFARAEGFDDALAAAKARLTDAESQARFDRVAQVLDGANLSLLKDDFLQLAGDRITRERFFGR